MMMDNDPHDANAAEGFLRMMEFGNSTKGRGGPTLSQQKQAKANETLSHILKRNETLTTESLERWKERLRSLPILSDVPASATLEDIESLISKELGTGICVTVIRMDGERISLQLKPSSTVKDLKERLKIALASQLEKTPIMGLHKISWKSTWTSFCLVSSDGQRLLDDSAKLDDLGVGNNSEVHFARYNAEKEIKDARPKREKRQRRNPIDDK